VSGYEWREDKDKKNKSKHGISLSAGVPVFEDEYRIESYDSENSTEHEDRYITIGNNKCSDVLYVCYTMREHGKTRLYSVRRATPPERRLYQRNLRR